MRKSIFYIGCFFAIGFAGAYVPAQDKLEVEHVIESLEELADEIGNVDDLGEVIEGMLEDHAEELEDWAEKYSKDWENWAEKFEGRFEKWAENHEKEWTDWAEGYSRKWERWAAAMEEGEWNPENVGELVQKNMEMLSDMPLGELIEGIMKEGADGIENAPWESLQDLQGMLQESIERSVAETERKFAEQKRNEAKRKHTKSKSKKDGLSTEFILPVIETQQDSLRRKEKVLGDMADDLMESLKKKLKSGELGDEDIESLMKLVAEQKMQRKKLQKHQQALAKQKQMMRKMEEKKKGLAREKSTADAENRKRKVEQARRLAEKRLTRSLEQVKEREGNGQAEQKQIELLLKAFEAEERKIEQKNKELEQLQKDVQQLRKELKILAKRAKESKDPTEK